MENNKTKRMKKEPLSTSMAKLIMTVSLIVCLGALIGAVGYLIMHKTQTNIPIVNLPVKSEAVVSIDKTLYGIGEPIKITLRNNTEKSIFSIAASLTPEFSITSIEQQKSDKTWEKLSVRCVWPECDIDFDAPSELKAGQSVTFDWTPGIHIYHRDMSLDEGVYRFGIDYQTARNQEWLKSYSKEFTVGEKGCPENCGEQMNVSNWQTYRNEEYGFEMKYPVDWTINTSRDGISLENYIFCSDRGRDGCFRVSIFLTQDEDSNSFQKIVEKMGKIATKTKDNKLFVFSIMTDEEKTEALFDKAMSTFKFTEIKSADNLLTYKNEKYNYQIGYPETYSIFQDLKQGSYETITVGLESKKIYITNNLSLFFCCEPVYLSIEILDNSVSENNFEEWVYNKEMINEDNSYRIIKKEYFDFAGERAYRTYNECGIDSPKNIIILNHGSNTYYIKYDHQSCFPKVEDILSTFKFIEK